MPSASSSIRHSISSIVICLIPFYLVKFTNVAGAEMIIIVFGLPGSGKSYFTERLAARLGVDYFDSDAVRRKMFLRRTYSNEETMAVYQKLLDVARTAIKTQKTIIIEASFNNRQTRDLFMNANTAVRFIEIVADESLITGRIAKPRAVSEADVGVYKEMKKHWEPFVGEHLVIQSTNNNIDAMLEKALVYLSA